MKHSRTWYALILIASALIPSAVQHVSAESPNRRSPESQVTQAQPSQNSAQTKEPSPRQVPTAELGVPESSAEKVKAEQHTGNSGGAAEPPTHDTFWAEWVMAIATTIYSFFAILQWRALRKTVDETQGLVVTANRQATAAEAQVANLEKTLVATEKAANAAKQSADATTAGAVAAEQYVKLTAELVRTSQRTAKIAELALNVERPYVFIERQEYKVRETMGGGLFTAATLLTRDEGKPTHAEVSVSFDIKNRGKGIAKITEVKLRLLMMPRITYRRSQLDFMAALAKLGRSKRIGRYHYPVLHPILGANEETNYWMMSGISVPLDRWKEMIKQKIPVIAIEVRYDDVFERSHLTHERFTYEFGMLFSSPPKRVREKHNN